MKSNRGSYRPSQEAFEYVERTTKVATSGPKCGKKDKQTTSWHVKDGKLTFGKYKGAKLSQILKTDHGYIQWACDNVEGFAANIPSKKRPKHSTPKPSPCKPSGLVKEVLDRMNNGTSPYVHSTNAPHNAFDIGGFPTQDRMDYHMSQLNPNHRMLEALEDHLDQNFMDKYGDQFDDDPDSAPPW